MKQKKVLVIDDNDEIRDLIQDHLHFLDIESEVAANIDQAKQLIEDGEERFDVIITDLMISGKAKGLDLVSWTRNLENSYKAKSRFIVITGYHSHFNEKVAQKYGVNTFLIKPFDPSLLEEHINNLFDSIEKGSHPLKL